MTTGVWLYPHDLRDISGLAGIVREAGVDDVCLMTTYHSLFAASPDNPARTIVDLPASGAYFRPDQRMWAAAAHAPRTSPEVAVHGDVLEHGRRFADAAGARLCSWIVCLHADPPAPGPAQDEVHIATGDVLRGVPCLRSPRVRDRVVRLVRDIAGRSDAVQLESLHWQAQPHAMHPKVDGLSPVLSRLVLSICFCDRCRGHARGAGVDADEVAGRLRTAWRQAWGGTAPDDPHQVEGLASYLRCRTDAVLDVAAEVVDAVEVPVEFVSFGDATVHGTDAAGMSRAGLSVRTLAYGPTEQVLDVCDRHVMEVGSAAGLHLGLSILPEHVRTEVEAHEAMNVAARHAESICLYHLGLAGDSRRSWLASLVETWRAARAVAT